MGCGVSNAAKREMPAVPSCLPPFNKPLNSWSEEEVSGWFGTLPAPLLKYRSALLPENGRTVSMWTEEYLLSCGLAAPDAKRLLLRRNAAAEEASAAASASPAAPASPEPSPPALGVPAEAPAAARARGAAVTVQVTTVTVRPSASKQQLDEVEGARGGKVGGDEDAGIASSGSAKKRINKETVVACLAKGVTFAKAAIEQVGPMLPFPGAEACQLLVTVLGMIDTAVTNHSNLAELRQRAAAFLDILTAYAAELELLRAYRGVVDEFRELLELISSYARSYCDRNCLMRLLTGSNDRGQYEELVAKLATLTERVMMAVAVDSNAKLVELQGTAAESAAKLEAVAAAVAEAKELLLARAQYKDPAAKARSLVDAAGGLDKVMADGETLRAVMQELDVGAQMTIGMVTSLLSAHLDRGPQRHIRHPDLRVFWQKQFQGEAEVPWFFFWEHFPTLLVENPADTRMVSDLGALLADDVARQAFQAAVERGNRDRDSVSVYELGVSFAGDVNLNTQVQVLLRQRLGGSSSSAAEPEKAAPPAASAGASQEQQPAQEAATVGVAPPGGAHNMAAARLPRMDKNYTGREVEAADIVDHLVTRGSIALLASGGMGKSSLALDVAWRMVMTGHAPGGALWVDLREAAGPQELQGRMCAAVGIQQEKTDTVSRVMAALKRMESSAGRRSVPGDGSKALPTVLIIVDNAEDSMVQPDSVAILKEWINKVMVETPCVRLLATSRVPLGLGPAELPERRVGGISPEAAERLVRATAGDLSASQARQVAEACRCVPLVLRLVAEALVAGRMAFEDVIKMAKPGDQDSSNGDDSVTVLRLVLRGLKRNHQLAVAQLAVFPSAFNEDGAGAVLDMAPQQLSGVLATLVRHNLLQHGGANGGQYVMHMAVRQVASEVGHQTDAATMGRAKARYMEYVLGLLAEWGEMYASQSEWKLALTMARDRQADVDRVIEMLSSVPANAAEAAGVCSPVVVGQTLESPVQYMLQDLGLMPRMEVACRALLQQLDHAEGEDPDGVASAKARVLSTLANISWDTNRPSEGEALARQALELQRTVDVEHLDVCRFLDIIAYNIYRQGDASRYTECEALEREALEVSLRVVGEEHTETALWLHHVALYLDEQGNMAEAEVMHRKALGIRQRVRGERHPDTAFSYEELALCIQKIGQDRVEEAQQLLQQTLAIRRQVLGPDHSDTVKTCLNLARAMESLGNSVDAEPLYRQVMDARSRTRGEDHPDTALAIWYLANNLGFRLGRYVEAEPVYRRGLAVKLRNPGPDHSTTQNMLKHFERCLKALGKTDPMLDLIK